MQDPFWTRAGLTDGRAWQTVLRICGVILRYVVQCMISPAPPPGYVVQCTIPLFPRFDHDNLLIFWYPVKLLCELQRLPRDQEFPSLQNVLVPSIVSASVCLRLPTGSLMNHKHQSGSKGQARQTWVTYKQASETSVSGLSSGHPFSAGMTLYKFRANLWGTPNTLFFFPAATGSTLTPSHVSTPKPSISKR